MKKALLFCMLLGVLPACTAASIDDESTAADEDGPIKVTAQALQQGVTASPNPLVFPNANFEGGVCGAPGDTRCTYASITLTNTSNAPQKILGASATSAFWVTWGGTCNSVALNKVIPANSSCTLEYGFLPTAHDTTYTGVGTVTFRRQTVDFRLIGKSNPALSVAPDPLVFPNADVGGGDCGQPGATSCTYATVTISNNTSSPKEIIAASATSPFWVTWGGTCNNLANNKFVPSHSSCTLQFGFLPPAAGTTYTGTGSISFATGELLNVGLIGTSN